MFYRDYRPQKFSDLIGADHVVSAFTSSLSKGSPSHAFFLTGTRGIGKTTTARLIAKAITCDNPSKNTEGPVYFEPCSECKSCKAIEQGNYLDLIEIDAASNRGIDNIRDLKDNVTLSPTSGKAKIYIIDEVHMLTTEASNALLKTLEEPPAHAYFILCTTNPEKVLETIKSRCQQFQFRRPSIQDLVEKLRIIANDKSYDISDEKLRRIAIVAKGAFREAETLLEQLIDGDDYIDALLNEQESNYYEFTSFLVNGNSAEAIRFVYGVQEGGANIEAWADNYIEYTRSLMLNKLGVTGIDDMYELNDLETKLIQSTELTTIKNIVDRFTRVTGEFKSTMIQTLPIELAIIDVTSEINGGEVKGNSDSLPNDFKEAPPAPDLAKNGVVTNHALKIERVKKDEKPKMKVEKVAEKIVGSEPEVGKDTLEKTKVKATTKSTAFPYKKLIQTVKPANHSIHLLLHSCKLESFDGKNLNLIATYSFHKERLLSNKIRNIVEEVASKLVGHQVVLNCALAKDNPKAKSLTDKNIVSTNGSSNIEEVFEQVFGNEVESAV